VNKKLDKMQYAADPIVDDVVAKILGTWPREEATADLQKQFARIEDSIRLLRSLTSNQSVKDSDFATVGDIEIKNGLFSFVDQARKLPAWLDSGKIQTAEQTFSDYGVITCVLFFCASLPEVYVVPDISIVLRSTGQLERATENRIRTTATMILTVMMKGGLLSPEGGGLSHILRARFIHSILRHTILRGNPSEISETRPKVEPLSRRVGVRNAFELMSSHGWDVSKDGLPCNQEELAYTLLTFSYVFLRGMRRLGLGLTPEQEEAYLHTWNVVGYLMGVREDLMVFTMLEAETLFEKMQERGRSKTIPDDPRPALGNALIDAIEKSISPKILKPLGPLITLFLCSEKTALDLGISERFSKFEKFTFFTLMSATRLVDALISMVIKNFSIRRFILRIVGYRLLATLLKDSTQPLGLSAALQTQVSQVLDEWSRDSEAPRWMNEIEDYFTAHGSWRDSLLS
jgi:hypothetical protein